MSAVAASPVDPPGLPEYDLANGSLMEFGQVDGFDAPMEPTASGSGVQTLWHPPEPSLDTLPVDASKTEPKPAYYKLQFGDDYTGFSYYVRTLAVIIGRKVVCQSLFLMGKLTSRKRRCRPHRQISGRRPNRPYRLLILTGMSI